MNSKFKISIPKPCHENWNNLTPNEKGKFCSSCSKTVVDFTKKSPEEIQEYLTENKNNKVCGHFYKKQLDSIVLEIPENTFEQQLSFQKLFLLALLFVMGTTLFSCQYENGEKQKIENVIIKDSMQKVKKEIDSLTILNPKDSTSVWVSNCPKEKSTLKKDSIIEINEILGELPILTVEGDIDYTEVEEEEIIVGFVMIQETPRFKEDKNLSKKEAKESFDKRIKTLAQENIKTDFVNSLGLRKGKHRAYAKFEIDEKGNPANFQVRAPHPKIEKEILKMFKKLPQFIPAKHNAKTVKQSYTFPITFIVE